MQKAQEDLSKTGTELANLKAKYEALQQSSDASTKGLEGVKKGLEGNLAATLKEMAGLSQQVAEQGITITNLKGEMKEKLEQVNMEFSDQIVEQKADIANLTENQSNLQFEYNTTKEDLAIAEEDLKKTKLDLKDTKINLKIRTEDLAVTKKLLDDATLQAEGASDAMESMRKDMNDLVEQEIADKENEFLATIAQFDQCKEDLVAANKKVQEAKNLQVQAELGLANELKNQGEMVRDLSFMRKQVAMMEKAEKKKNKDETDRLAETEKLYKENDYYKGEIAFIYQTYELDKVEDQMLSAKKTEQWAE